MRTQTMNLVHSDQNTMVTRGDCCLVAGVGDDDSIIVMLIEVGVFVY